MWENFKLAQMYPFKGAYVLRIRLQTDRTLPVKSLKMPELRAGDYLYCGSAFGPGGVGARVARHVRRDKKCHWHVDHLTTLCGVWGVHLLENQTECQLVADLLARDLAVPAYPGFGSSDCQSCTAHLLRQTGAKIEFKPQVFLEVPR